MPLILDTGFVLALLNLNDRWHPRCLDAWERETSNDRLIPSLVLVELDYMTREHLPPAAWESLYEDICSGVYSVDLMSEPDLVRSLELVKEYRQIKLQLADASVVALGERLGETRIATVDRRDFRRVRPLHCDAFTLLPEGSDDP